MCLADLFIVVFSAGRECLAFFVAVTALALGSILLVPSTTTYCSGLLKAKPLLCSSIGDVVVMNNGTMHTVRSVFICLFWPTVVANVQPRQSTNA